MEHDNELPEDRLAHCLLVIILVFAACVRFYGIDEVGLSAAELFSLQACDARGWFAMAAGYATSTGMPPAYPTLLCHFLALTSDADFFVRALSALLGMVSVYIVYCLGRHCFSAATGLLAAAFVATNLQTVLVDRTATLYSLLTFGMLLHAYFYCRLLVPGTATQQHDMTARATGKSWRLEWTWQPGPPFDARCLLGFWISGALIFYTNPISLLLLLVELGFSFSLAERASRVAQMRTLWLPLFIAMLPWVPKLYGLSEWVLQGNLFSLISGDLFVFKVSKLLPIDSFSFAMQSMMALSAIGILGIQVIKQKQTRAGRVFALLTLQVAMTLAALYSIKASDDMSYHYYKAIATLIVAYPIGVVIGVWQKQAWRWALTYSLTILLLIFQVNYIAKSKYYQLGGDAGFRLAAQIVLSDDSPGKENRVIVSSSRLFDRYLAQIASDRTTSLTLSDINVDLLQGMMQQNSFYYLEYAGDDSGFQKDYPVYSSLKSRYTVVCMTKVPRFRITKFSSAATQSENDRADCRDSLPGEAVWR